MDGRSETFAPRPDPRVGYGTPDRAALERCLVEQARRHGPATPVTIDFENGVPCQVVVDALDVCRGAGFRDVAVSGGDGLPAP